MADKERKRPWEKAPGRFNQAKPKPREWGNSSEYRDRKWIATSKKIRGIHVQCMKCEIAPSDVCDHIIPIKFGGDKYDWRNLWALCHSCHNSKTRKEQNGPIFKSYYNDRGNLVATWRDKKPILKPRVKY